MELMERMLSMALTALIASTLISIREGMLKRSGKRETYPSQSQKIGLTSRVTRWLNLSIMVVGFGFLFASATFLPAEALDTRRVATFGLVCVSVVIATLYDRRG
tara:strand:- start:151 stop:462 length:312 start_codon:yes stop_codon:yes gene_type:complete